MPHRQATGGFYPLTPEITQTLRNAKLTAAEWRIWSYLISIDPWGDRYVDYEPMQVWAECGCSKTTFYRAISKFQELELFDFQFRGASLKNQKGASKACQSQNSSPKNETPSFKNETPSFKNETPSFKNETSASGRYKDRARVQTYTDFKDSLSEETREKFLAFVEREIKDFPRPIHDIEAWLASETKAGEKRWEIYHKKFKGQKERTLKRPSLKEEAERRRAEVKKILEAEKKEGERANNPFSVVKEAKNDESLPISRTTRPRSWEYFSTTCQT